MTPASCAVSWWGRPDERRFPAVASAAPLTPFIAPAGSTRPLEENRYGHATDSVSLGSAPLHPLLHPPECAPGPAHPPQHRGRGVRPALRDGGHRHLSRLCQSGPGSLPPARPSTGTGSSCRRMPASTSTSGPSRPNPTSRCSTAVRHKVQPWGALGANVPLCPCRSK